jgi:hypothetical protein
MTLILHSRESVSQTLRDSGSPRVPPSDFDIYMTIRIDSQAFDYLKKNTLTMTLSLREKFRVSGREDL